MSKKKTPFSELSLKKKIRLSRLADKRKKIRHEIILRIFEYEDAGKLEKAERIKDRIFKFNTSYKSRKYPLSKNWYRVGRPKTILCDI